MKATLETNKSLWLESKSFSNVLVKMNSHWDYKLKKLIIGKRRLSIFIFVKAQIECDCIEAGNVNGIIQPFSFTFVLNIHTGFKNFCETETKLYKKNK